MHKHNIGTWSGAVTSYVVKETAAMGMTFRAAVPAPLQQEAAFDPEEKAKLEHGSDDH